MSRKEELQQACMNMGLSAEGTIPELEARIAQAEAQAEQGAPEEAPGESGPENVDVEPEPDADKDAKDEQDAPQQDAPAESGVAGVTIMQGGKPIEGEPGEDTYHVRAAEGAPAPADAQAVIAQLRKRYPKSAFVWMA